METYFENNSIGTKKVNIIEYYSNKIKNLDQQISALKGEGVSKNQGIAFVTFSSIEWVFETFTDLDLIKDIAKNSEASKLMRINNWYISQAPPPSDIIWENLSNLTRFKRKTLRCICLGIICLISTSIIIILAILDKLAPLMHNLYSEDNPHMLYTMIALQYLTPTTLLLYNYIVVPIIVKKFIERCHYIRRSHQEKSNLSWNYICLIANTIFVPITFFTIVHSYRLMPTGCFFLRYLIQTLFIYWLTQIFGVPQIIDKYLTDPENSAKNFSSSSAKVIDLDLFNEYEQTPTNTASKICKVERSNKWYFEMGYQQSFSISIFALIFVSACVIPAALPIGSLFFWLKYYIDKYNMIFGYRIEYEANAYIRKRVWTFSVLAINFFQIIMIFSFLITGDDDLIVLSFLLLIFSILATYYFISTEAWKGKLKKDAVPNIDTFDDDKTDSSDEMPPPSADFKELKMRKKSSSIDGSKYRPEQMKVEGMTPPSASPFKVPMFNETRRDAYLHPWAKKFSTEEVFFNKENSFRSFARFSQTDYFAKNSLSRSDSETPSNSMDDSSKNIKYRGIGDFLTQSLYE